MNITETPKPKTTTYKPSTSLIQNSIHVIEKSIPLTILTNERYKAYQGWDFGTLGCPGANFFKHGHVPYQIDGDNEQNRVKIQFSSQVQTGDLGVRSKGQYH